MQQVTIDKVVNTGGWWWFNGAIAIDDDLVITGTQALFVPLPENNVSNHVIIAFWGEWLDAESFEGQWIGPVECPFENGRES